jgi:hypothetical protein
LPIQLLAIRASAKITYKTLTFHITNAGFLRDILIPPKTNNRTKVMMCEFSNLPVVNLVYMSCTNVATIIA